MAKKKNQSDKIPVGRTVQTRDEYFEGQKDYRKKGYGKKGNYRKAVVVDTNKKDELALVKLTTSKEGTPLPDYKQGKSKYRPYVETVDKRGKPIKLNNRFKENPPGADVSKRDVNKIKKDCLTNPKTKEQNRNKLRRLKGRK